MNDLLYKGHFKGLDIAFSYAVTTQSVNESVVRHDCDPAAAHLLARATTAGLLAASVLPEHQRLNACWKYQGGLKTIVVDAGADGSVRSLISPNMLSDFGDAHDALYGEVGSLQVVVTEGARQANSGSTPVSLHDVVNDLAYHYCISDQVETGMSVMVGFNPDPEHPVRICRGLMVQALPGTDLERLDRVRRRMDGEPFRALLQQDGEAEGAFEALVQTLVAEEKAFDGVYMDACPAPHFSCTCSKAKMSAVVRSLPVPERMALVKRKEDVAISCQFCNERYLLTIDECIVAWNEKLD